VPKIVAQKLETAAARERLRRRYLPARVRMLFIGEAPPASGRFFYQADSGLYRAVRRTFMRAIPAIRKEDFLDTFAELGCYLTDLCGEPIDDLNLKQRRTRCGKGETQLTRTIKKLQPEIIITLVLSIAPNVERAIDQARWKGLHVQLPYPGRWKRNRLAFDRGLRPLLQREFRAGNFAKWPG
jgi:hypothetical protein